MTVSWSRDQLEDNYECVDRFEVGVENLEDGEDGEDRKLCSVASKDTAGHTCRLDVSGDKYCDMRSKYLHVLKIFEVLPPGSGSG